MYKKYAVFYAPIHAETEIVPFNQVGGVTTGFL